MDEFCINECEHLFLRNTYLELIIFLQYLPSPGDSAHEKVSCIDLTNLHWVTVSKPNHKFLVLRVGSPGHWDPGLGFTDIVTTKYYHTAMSERI